MKNLKVFEFCYGLFLLDDSVEDVEEEFIILACLLFFILVGII